MLELKVNVHITADPELVAKISELAGLLQAQPQEDGKTPKVTVAAETTAEKSEKAEPSIESTQGDAENTQVTFEDLRTALAALSAKGHAAAIRELLTKHGADKLSDVKPEDYAAILREAEAMANG